MRRLHLPDSGAKTEGERITAPSATRNLAPILAVLDGALPESGRALELASGTGQHIAAFAERFPGLEWQPSDANPGLFPSIAAWAEGGRGTLRSPVVLDACEPGWAARLGPWQAISLTNLLHLISQSEAETLLSEVARALAPGGVFCLYGPFSRAGELVSPGDRAFDARLRAQDPEIGYKSIENMRGFLIGAGLVESACHEMPASNLMLVTQRPAAD